MVTIQELLTAAKVGAGIPSNYRLARVLGVNDNTVGHWQHGRKFPDDATAARLAEMAGLDVGAVVAAMHAERAGEGPERALWERIARRLEAGAVAAVVGLVMGGAPDAGAAAPLPGFQALPIGGLYIMSTRLRALLAAAVRRRRSHRVASPKHWSFRPAMV